MSHKILVVDDEEDIRHIMAKRLEMNGYEVKQVANGEEALVAVADFLPDLMLLDIMMPRMDGFEVCQHIRSDQKYDYLKIIFLTAKSEDWDILQGYYQGGDSYLVKPVNIEILFQEIQKALDHLKVDSSNG